LNVFVDSPDGQTADRIQVACPECKYQTLMVLPVEPLFLAGDIAMMLSTTRSALHSWMSRNAWRLGPAKYRWVRGRRQRLLTMTDARVISDRLMHSRPAR